MKKLSIFVLCAVLLLSLIGCVSRTSSNRSVAFFYCTKDIDHEGNAGAFGKELRNSAAYSEDIELLLNEYLKGPESDGLYSPFPEGSSVKRAKREGNVLTIYLSSQFDRIPLDRLSLALACLAQTCFQNTSAPVLLLIPDGTFIDGSTNRTLTADSFMFSDDNTTYLPPQ